MFETCMLRHFYRTYTSNIYDFILYYYSYFFVNNKLYIYISLYLCIYYKNWSKTAWYNNTIVYKYNEYKWVSMVTGAMGGGGEGTLQKWKDGNQIHRGP